MRAGLDLCWPEVLQNMSYSIVKSFDPKQHFKRHPACELNDGEMKPSCKQWHRRYATVLVWPG